MMQASTSSTSIHDLHATDTRLTREASHASSMLTPTDDRSSHGGLSSSSSRSLVISPNLNAALEYDQRTRGESSGEPSSLLGVGGLRPPPRAKSRGTRTARSPPASPNTRRPSSSLPSSPTVALSAPNTAAAGASALNPYINPAPRLVDLKINDRRAASSTDTSADTQAPAEHDSPNDSPTTSSVQSHDDSRTPTDSSISPVLPGTGADQRPGARHNRYLSSLQRVEKMIGKGKNVLGFSDTSIRSARRVSDADLHVARAHEKTSKDALLRRMLERDRGGKSPMETEYVFVPGSPTSDTASRLPASSPRSVGSPPRTLSTGRMAGLASPPPRPALSHARQASDMSRSSFASLSSEDTHDLPSSTTERRISISSTLYTSNRHSFESHHRSAGRSSMSPDRESFIDLASPPFSPDLSEFVISDKLAVHPLVTHLSIPVSPTAYHAHDSIAPEIPVKPQLPRLTTGAKPPLPTTPKPVFRRSRSAQPPSRKSRHHDSTKDSAGPSPDTEENHALPATTNHLHPRERADRVRKTRKLTQLFGQTPGTIEPPSPSEGANNGCLPMPSPLTLNLTKRKSHRAAVSMSDDGVLPMFSSRKRAIWPPPEDTQYIHFGGRRHSTPLSPQEFLESASMLDFADPDHVIEIGPQNGVRYSDWDSHAGEDAPEPGSSTSFIDLSEEDVPRGALSDSLSVDTPRLPHPFSPTFPTTPSVAESISEEQQAEEDRRRKREKLAKLHRFLGSRVPAHLVLGPLDEGVPLPPAAAHTPTQIMADDDADARRSRMRRRRSSSAAEFSRTWSDEIDRLKEELNEREKAINVRRAVKMEKMFGVAPPQMLYHTRQAVSSPGSITAYAPPMPKLSPFPKPSSQAPSPSIPSGRNSNPSKGKQKRNGRPGTAESMKPLLPPEGNNSVESPTISDVYLHYRHSLNSLNDIIDRDDKQSLAELHDYLSGGHQTTPPHTPTLEQLTGTTSAPSKAERRRSLPARSSMVSTISEFSVASPDPEETTFQQRRRKAAKLTQFFGVDYHDVMNEVLESIEKGLEEERGKGTLRPDEVQDLQQKLGRLKVKRNKIS